jgi:histidinol-phosphate aminotransferase
MANLQDTISMIQPHLRSLTAYEGAEPPEVLAAYAGIPEAEIVKLNGNENPYGPSLKVHEALANLQRTHLYPDPKQTAMRKSIGNYAGLPPEYVVVGNGSDEIIDLLFRAFLAPGQTVINCTPTFGMYHFNVQVCGGVTLVVPRNDHFEIDVDAIIEASKDGARLIALASPNNPTGNITKSADVQRLLEAGLVVILDEAYFEFGKNSMASAIPVNPNLVVIRTFSKWAGLAGLRIGYGLMNPELASILMKFKPPFSMNQAAEAALMASLEDLPALQTRVSWICQERDRMYDLLKGMPDIFPWPSEGNFILCQLPEGRGKLVYEGLAYRGVFVRYFAHGSLSDCIRVSIGTSNQTDQFLETLKIVLDNLP